MVQTPATGPLTRIAMAYVLAGGRGSRLMELTDVRAKPAVYFGGNSQIIDFALSTRSIPASAAWRSPPCTRRIA